MSARIYLACIFAMAVAACSTRHPEEPSGNRGSFTPPTSASLVVDNFRNAVMEKNTENFISCLADSSTRSARAFRFEPSAEIAARFSTLFTSWSLQKERQAFLSLISRMSIEQRPELDLTSQNVAFSSPDSIVFVADYQLTANTNLDGVPSILTGTMSLTITPEPSGLWSIQRWSDSRRAADTSETTWSLLKARLTN